MKSLPIRDMFNALVPEYDRFNRVSSLGLDSHWRNQLIRTLHGKEFVLDVGTGTGKVAQGLARQGARALGIDFSEGMISSAQKRTKRNPNLSFGVASTDALPYGDGTFDGVSSAFVIRNLHEDGVLEKSFAEFSRVLKSGGAAAHLELMRPPKRFMALGHDLYIRTILPLVGRSLFRSRWPKNYLKRTIEKFPLPEEVCQKLRQAGFESVSHTPLHGGIAGIYFGVKC